VVGGVIVSVYRGGGSCSLYRGPVILKGYCDCVLGRWGGGSCSYV
jgi:hypothetical protein